jgi:GLPGLI family protein
MIKSIVQLALLFPLSAFSQLRFDYEYKNIEPVDFIATYSLDFLQDTTNPDKKRNATMLLFIGESVSLFVGKTFYSSDTISRKFKNIDQLQEHYLDRNRPFPKFLYRVYKNYPQGKLTFIEHIIGGTFKFEEDLDMFNWKLTDDTATISGFKTQRATCDFGGRSWIAWFTPEIPFSDGPYKFNGLPGLILKIGDTKNHYVFEFISIYKPENEIIIDMKEEDFIESSKLEFFRAKDAFRDDIISRAKEAGLSSGSQQIAAKNMAKRNNPIELIRK